jgi:hypothetical protein
VDHVGAATMQEQLDESWTEDTRLAYFSQHGSN